MEIDLQLPDIFTQLDTLILQFDIDLLSQELGFDVSAVTGIESQSLQDKDQEIKATLTCGVSGQDGAYLAKLWLSKEYKVCVTSRDVQISLLIHVDSMGKKYLIS